MFFLGASFVAALAVVVNASPAAAAVRDAETIWIPHILTPNRVTVWHTGHKANVTWETSDAPEVISNGAAIQLRKGSEPFDGYLAEGFDLRAGFVEVDVPYALNPDDDYLICLFGDSGNFSEEFTIRPA
ncbi:hypothetical protein HDZ31DRAFT_64646 [Schizophyllum fasciatum]